MDKIIESPVFSRLKADRPQDLKKIIPVVGDIHKSELGLSIEDQKRLIDEVSVVFHVAASVDFDEELISSLKTNLIGTANTLNLIHRMKNIKSFVHVSTAYCNTHLDVLEEKVYLPPAPLDDILKYLEEPKLNRTRISKLYRDRPNTYTFAKALAEHYVLRNHGSIPTVIVRPSIVVSSFKEPIPGWSDTIQGSTALVATSWKGLNRVVLGKQNNVVDFIPVDYVSNLLVVAAAKCHSSRDVIVHNCCTSSTQPLTLKMIVKFLHNKEADKSPYNITYPRVIFTENKQLLSILLLLLQTGPAYAADLLRRIRGKKPMYMKVQSQLRAAHNTLGYFTSNSWTFKSDSTQRLHNSLQPSDKNEFNFNPSDVKWDEFFDIYLNGIEQFLLKSRNRK
ncbi:putative fatty acyl-CoA reductase CG5065 [Trichoplusia ni]|uniref:Fatty acyl-CoA reductase n=1 Tax=Trichoplusia ni TaxID=7111 RepID=A0A7E5VWS0_TRINI|nr:putative fatty acyl-CoA reductase CG5065 [Trichoplusia ni]